MKYKFLCPTLLILACSGPKNVSNPVFFKNKTLEKIVIKYALLTDSIKSKTSPITVSIDQGVDTANVAIVYALPDLTIAQYFGSTKVENHLVYIVGTTGNSNRFFTMTMKSEIPPELKEDIQRRQELRDIPPTEEPQAWFLRFKDSVLIDYLPKEQIDSLIPRLKSR
jgi:hypothetical protein